MKRIDLKAILAKHEYLVRVQTDSSIMEDPVLKAMEEVWNTAVDKCKRNVAFIETTSEKLNSEDYKPFITADDNTMWTIDLDSIEQVKQMIL